MFYDSCFTICFDYRCIRIYVLSVARVNFEKCKQNALKIAQKCLNYRCQKGHFSTKGPQRTYLRSFRGAVWNSWIGVNFQTSFSYTKWEDRRVLILLRWWLKLYKFTTTKNKILAVFTVVLLSHLDSWSCSCMNVEVVCV